MSWLAKSDGVFVQYFIVSEMEITQFLHMNLVYFTLLFKECKIGYSNVIANVTRRLIR